MRNERDVAMKAVAAAIHAGRLAPSPCVVCTDPNTVAHHPRGYDPSHRLDVVWLCRRCHLKIHGGFADGRQYPGLRARRELAGLSLDRLQSATGINKGTLSRYERGFAIPDAHRTLIEASLASAADAAPDRVAKPAQARKVAA